MRRVFHSLRSRLLFYIISITVLIFASIAYVAINTDMRERERWAHRYSGITMENLALEMGYTFAEVKRTVNETAPVVQANLASPQRMMDIVERMVVSDPELVGGSIAFVPDFYGEDFMEYVTIGTDSVVVRKHLGNDSTYDYTRMEWFAGALADGKSGWSEPYYDLGGGDVPMTTFTQPIKDNAGRTVAVLTADVALEDIVEEVKKLQPFDNSYAFVLSGGGHYVAHPDSSVRIGETYESQAARLGLAELKEVGREMVAGKTGSKRLTLDGVDVKANYTAVPHTDWSVCAVVPYSVIMQAVGNTSLRVLGILLCGLLALVVCILVITHNAMKPMLGLTEAMSHISRGNFDEEVPAVTTRDELQQMRSAFVLMQQSLKKYVAQVTEQTRAQERIDSELDIARRIQMNLVPREFPPIDGGNAGLHGFIKPARQVGGDFYDYVVRDRRVIFVIGDVSGKGVPASLVMAVTCTLFRIAVGRNTDATQIVGEINRGLCEKNDSDLFVTIAVGVLDLDSGEVDYCNAGHLQPVLIDASRSDVASLVQVDTNIPLGIVADYDYQVDKFTLGPGAKLLLYTDGLTEAEDASRAQFGMERALGEARECAAASEKELLERLSHCVAAFVDGAPQSDDMTMLAVGLVAKKGTEDRLDMTNDIDSVAQLEPWVKGLAEANGWDEALRLKVNLALEEAVVNVVNYAYPDGVKGDIGLLFTSTADALTWELRDQGREFNPLEDAPEPDVESGVEERPVGGLGILLVTSMMDSVTYRREDDTNVLTMTMKRQ